MAIPLSINGAVFEYPQNFDEDWGVDATGWAQAVTAGALFLSGGNFPLTAQVDFGTSFGIKVKSILTETANPSTSGYIALAHADTIGWRNNGGGGNLLLSVDSSDMLRFNGSVLGLTALADNFIYVGNASNVPVAVAMSGDATIVASGALTIANSAITNAKVSASAAVALSKLATVTASRALASDGGGLIVASSVTSTELGYLSGVTSSIQTQLGTYLPLAGGTMSGAINMASNKILSVTNGSNSGDAVAFNQLKYFQTVQVINAVQFSTISTGFQTTNLSASITPSSNSHRVKITVSGDLQADAAGEQACLTVSNGGSNLGSTQGMATLRNNSTSVARAPVSFVFIDTPATTSSVTYNVQLRSTGASSVSFPSANAPSCQIILEEIV